MMSILDKIIAFKRQEVAERKQHLNEDALIDRLESIEDEPRGFFRAVRAAIARDKLAVIAEIRRATLNGGMIRDDFDTTDIARQYAENGAACLSVVTDKKFFMGNDIFLRHARQAVDLPVLRRDFIVDRYQIVESRVLGADAIMLIAAALSDAELREYTLLAHDLGMDVLVETYNLHECERALQLPIRVIGVNNRDLDDFSLDLETSVAIKAGLSNDYCLISEGGIHTYDDLRYLQGKGIQAILVGSALMAEEKPGIALKTLLTGDLHGA